MTNKAKHVMPLVFSFIFHALFLAIMVFASIATLCIGIWLPLTKRIYIPLVTQYLMSWLLQILCKVKVEITYENYEQIAQYRQQKRSCLIVANHQSQWETFYLQKIFLPLINVLKRELINIPLLGWALYCYWPVIVERTKIIRSIKYIQKQGTKRLQAGYNVLIFPQSTRLTPGTLGKVSASAARLAVTSKAIVIPVTHNAGEHWPKRGWHIHSGTIRLHIHAPLDATHYTTEEITNYYTTCFTQTILHNSSTTTKSHVSRN